MHKIIAAVVCTTVVAAPAFAQPMDRMHHRNGQSMDRMHHRNAPRPAAGMTTPDVNAAYMGGGVILEGPPNAPAPMPQATPTGETPRYMVEPGTAPAHPLMPLQRTR